MNENIALLQMAERFVGERQAGLAIAGTPPKKKPALYAQAVHPSKGSIMDQSLGTSLFQRGTLRISPGRGYCCDPDHISRFDLPTRTLSAIGCSVTPPKVPRLAGEQFSWL